MAEMKIERSKLGCSKCEARRSVEQHFADLQFRDDAQAVTVMRECASAANDERESALDLFEMNTNGRAGDASALTSPVLTYVRRVGTYLTIRQWGESTQVGEFAGVIQ